MSDDIPLEPLFVLLAILLILSAFFAATETALMRVNKYRIRHLARKGNKSAVLTEKLLKQPEKLIAFILFGNNLVNFVAASIVGVISMEIGGPTGVAVGTILLTMVVLLIAESPPKTLAALFPEKIALPASRLYYPLVKLFKPLYFFINFFTNIILKILDSKPDKNDERLSIDQLKTLIADGMTKTSIDRQKIMMGVLDLGNITVEDIMLPHNEIIGIDLNNTNKNNRIIIEGNFHSSLPVYEDVLDNIKGVLNLNTFLKEIDLSSYDNQLIKKYMNKPYFIPEKTSLSQQLVEFKNSNQKLGFAVDEYGNIQGLITIEDIFEEIVGDYLEETKKLNKEIMPKKVDDYFIVNASSNIRVLNKMMNWTIPIDEAKTINGAILENLGYIPEVDAEFTLGNYLICIISTKENAIETIKIKDMKGDYQLKVVS
ncbi:MAG: CNNM domain-containing protein [Gammaproteobacteria bacterium]|nr:CNNM domain-containing protein [Gammaproteobacteria bacterium]MDC0188829.1 CNNM domain-containing protein [Gammaproteobacteria bacterium]